MSPPLPEEAYAAALAGVEGLGPRTLGRLLRQEPPSELWRRVRSGHPADRARRWRDRSRDVDVAEVWSVHRRLGIGVSVVGTPAYPERLAGDVDAPGVLFHLGDPSTLGPWARVAVVGTRSATRYGLGVAAQLGAELAAAGVSVVSGLALGVDGAAHEGAVAGRVAGGDEAGPPVAVAAGGLDRPYPARHASLWRRVAAAGVVLSTAPAGRPVQQWRFPQRNRLMAALSDVVVVVESHHGGGSLYTAHEAVARSVPVGAVPGSIRSPASGGTNDLLAEGAFPVRDVIDVLSAVDLAVAGRPGTRRLRLPPAPDRRSGAVPGPVPPPLAMGTSLDPHAERVLEALGHERGSVDQLLARTSLTLGELCAALQRLEAAGRVVEEGGWWERP